MPMRSNLGYMYGWYFGSQFPRMHHDKKAWELGISVQWQKCAIWLPDILADQKTQARSQSKYYLQDLPAVTISVG